MEDILISNRQIRLFISSTFQDMQGERVSLLEGSRSYMRDCLVMKYRLACAEMDGGLFEKAEEHVDYILNEIETFNTEEYDDVWECYKAEVMGRQVLVKKALGKYEAALESCERTICHWEDIEDWRIEKGDYIATIDKVEYYSDLYYEIEDMLQNRN